MVLAYCVSIQYFPKDLSLGDSLFFLASLVGFALGYSLVVAALYGFALATNVLLRFPLSWMLSAAVAVQRRLGKDKDGDPKSTRFPPTSIDEAPLAIAGLFAGLILVFYATQHGGRFALGVYSTIVIMVLLRGAFLLGSQRTTPETGSSLKAKAVFVTTIFAIPIVFGVISTRSLDFAMELIGVRKAGVDVLVEAPYQHWIKGTADSTAEAAIEGWQEFNGATILFQGIGSEIVIEIKERRFVLPATSVVVSYPARPKERS